MNIVLLHGVLAREPDVRELPSGDHVASFDLTVRDDGYETEVVPVTWPSAPLGSVDKLEPGSDLIVTGRVRRRFFRAGGATQSRTEVVASAVLPSRQAKAAHRAIDAALATEEEWLPR